MKQRPPPSTDITYGYVALTPRAGVVPWRAGSRGNNGRSLLLRVKMAKTETSKVLSKSLSSKSLSPKSAVVKSTAKDLPNPDTSKLKEKPKGAGATKITLPKGPMIEELHFRSDSAFLCLIVNRRTKLIRVIDFRAGALPAKRLFIQSVAQREGIEKVITIVEKDEVSSWTRVGFVREGTVPGFYKRSDGHVCGCVIGERTASIEVSDDGHRLADRTINQAKKVALDLDQEIRNVSMRGIDSRTALSIRDAVWAKGEAMTGFEPFGRGTTRLFLEAAPKKGQANYFTTEFQDCFGHSLIEMLHAPTDEQGIMTATAGLRTFSEELKKRGIVSVFGFAPSDDVNLATTFLSAGFKKTGLLARGILIGRKRSDAILWTRKLLNPGDEDGDGLE